MLPVLDEGALDGVGGLGAAGARWATAFVEKPAPMLARQMIDDGALWHSGVIVARARVVLDSLGTHTPELEVALAALRADDTHLFAGMTRSVSIERGLLERLEKLAVVPGDFGWDDVGDFDSLATLLGEIETREGTREPGPVVLGDASLVRTIDSTGVVVPAGGRLVAVFGLPEVVVVDTPDALLVTTQARAQEVKQVVEALKRAGRTDLT